MIETPSSSSSFCSTRRQRKIKLAARPDDDDVRSFLSSSHLTENGLDSAENLFARAADFTYLSYLAIDERDAKKTLEKHGFVILELGFDSSDRKQMREWAEDCHHKSKTLKIGLNMSGSKPREQTPADMRPHLRNLLLSSGKFKEIIEYLGFAEDEFPIEKVYPQLLYSKRNREQKWHTDYFPVDKYKGTKLNKRRTFSFIFACGSAGDGNSFLELKPYGMRKYVCCTIKPGTVLVFGNDVLHRGSEYRRKNIRLHCTVDHRDFKRPKDKTVDDVNELPSNLELIFDDKQYKAKTLPKKHSGLPLFNTEN